MLPTHSIIILAFFNGGPMSKITLIEQQQKNKHRYNIYLDDVFAFGVGEQTLLFFALHKDMVITPQLQKQILKYDTFQRLYLIGVNYISYRFRSEKEVRDKLAGKLEQTEDEAVQKNYQKMIDLAIKQLKSDGYINDVNYANLFTQECLTLTGKGPRHIKQTLLKKGIDLAVIQQSLEMFSNENLIETAIRLGQDYAKKQSGISKNALKQKVINHLTQRGFSFDIAKQTLVKLDFNLSDTQQKENCYSLAKKQYAKLFHKEKTNALFYKLKTFLYQKGYTNDDIEWAIRQLKEQNDT